MYYLEVETPEGIKRIQLTRNHMSIGRLSYNDIVLPSAQISRQHAELRLINGEWWIKDLHSTNGLHFNTQRVLEHRLTPGDCVALAPDITIRFLSGTAATARSSDLPNEPEWRAAGGLSAGPTAGPRSPLSPDVAPLFPGGLPATMNGRSPTPRPDARSQAQTGGPSAGNFPMPPGPLNAGGELGDPYRRSIPANEAHRATAGPAQKHLHVCQTCGQLTAPDAIFCQSCHQSIAYECPNCRLSILPIQERCPRCQTPNPGSVRRQRPTGI